MLILSLGEGGRQMVHCANPTVLPKNIFLMTIKKASQLMLAHYLTRRG